MAVGEIVAAARVRAGLTQQQLANRAGIDSSQLSRIERGACDPYVSTIGKLADALGVHTAELLGGRAPRVRAS